MRELLKTLCAAAGVNGEPEASRVIADALADYVPQVQTDAMGNVWGVLPATTENAPTLLLEAHLDEIGFVVTGVSEDGFLRVSASGGVDERTLAAAEVVVLCSPPLNGVFCSTPPHLAGADSKPLTTAQRGIDVGLSGEEARRRVPVGTRVMFAPRFDALLGDRICAKALDDRAGVAAVLRALELLQNTERPCHVAALFCVQEEVGCRGAAPAAFAIYPDAAIVTDVSFAYTPDADKTQCGVLGDGAMLGVSPILDERLIASLRRLAEKQNIPFQHEVMGGSTGTDADKISTVREGIPTALLSIPLRYMHTPVEVASLGDIEAVARLMAALALSGEVRADA